MVLNKRKFDAKAYWARKPMCSVCNKHKVKIGNICYKCKKDNIEITDLNPQRDLIKKTINMEESSSKVKLSQIKFDKNFVKKLLDKLKIGNSRSIHLNAIPGRSSIRLDLSQLSVVNENLPNNFIDVILNNEGFSFPISYDQINLNNIDEDEKKLLELTSKRLNTIVVENSDSFLEYGIKNFGFGYPLLIKRDKSDPTKIIKAPIFIWHLDIERSYQNKNTWVIKKDEGYPIKINELLISHLSKDEAIQIEKISKEIIEDGILDKNELLKLIENILSQLNAKTENLSLKIEKCPDKNQIEAISNSIPWIQWSGVFGIYRSQNETIIHSTEELLERFDEFEKEELVLDQFQTSTISAVETDPSKEEIVNTLTKDEVKLIQGPPGTGKSQSITAIISNALANNAKCLIVCEKKTALDVIQANLEKIGLGEFSIVIDDVNKDRKKVIEKARYIYDSKETTQFAKLNFDSKYNKFIELKEEINSRSSRSSQIIFGDFSWKQLIGLYLKYSKSGELNQIAEKLTYKELKFNHEEYSSLVSNIEEAGFLFNELEKDSEKTFSMLDNSLFDNEYKWSSLTRIKEKTAEFYNILKLANIFISEKQQSDYEEKGISLFEENNLKKCELVVDTAILSLEKIISLHSRGINLAGNKFDEKNLLQNFEFNFFSIFSNKNKEICNIRNEIPLLFKTSSDAISELCRFDLNGLELKSCKEISSFRYIEESIPVLLFKIKKIKSKIDSIKELKSQLQRIESDLISIKKNKFFDFEIKPYMHWDSHKFICDYFLNLQSNVEKIQISLDAYESFHNWKYFISNKSGFEIKIFTVLKEIPTENWKSIFMAWYYRAALLNYEEHNDIGFNKSDVKLQQLASLYEELGALQIKQISSNWSYTRKSAISSSKHNFNALYNLRKNKSFGRQNSLRKIIDIDLQLFTSLFPVILTNPGAANAILPLKKGLFNLVIFDEASQLRVADTFTSLIRGQYKIIAGDEHQMPPSSYFQSSSSQIENEEDEDGEFNEEDEHSILAESESLLQFASDLKIINKSYLDFHYRSNHPALIEFSNCAFYGGNLISFPAQEVYRPIEFRSVNGRYETRTNPSEVAEIIKIIKDEIHLDKKGKMPSVGIATFNINQRNLIIETLNIASETDQLFAKKLQELREAGLFVKNLENIQGDERDIMIISTTYGIKTDGTFSQNFARLNRMEGYKLLNVLITRAKHKLYICTSIPKERYLSYLEMIKNEGNNKRGILYAYLTYAEAVSNHDNLTAQSILRLLKEQSYEKPRAISSSDGVSESPFEEEVYELLLDHFKKEEIVQQHKIGGFRLDFLIKTKKKDIVLECDGKAYHQSEEAYAYDMYRQKELEKLGFIVYRIWSTNWFEDKDLEMKKLLNFIEALNG